MFSKKYFSLFTLFYILYLIHPSSGRSVYYNRNSDFIRTGSAPIYRDYRSAAYTRNNGNPSQQRTMVFHGYYAQPIVRTHAVPEGAMTAFAAGETVATGSAYLPPIIERGSQTANDCLTPRCQEYGNNFNVESNSPNDAPQSSNPPVPELQPPANNIPEIIEDQNNNQIPNEPETVTEQEQPEQPSPTTTVVVPTVSTTQSVEVSTQKTSKNGLPPKKHRKVVVDEDADNDEEEDSDYNPFYPGRRNFPIYNSFFPMMFGGGSGLSHGSKRGSNDGASNSYPGGATAIANSFSTGKGGVATSHATAYGGPRP